jgi:hypothetical protein
MPDLERELQQWPPIGDLWRRVAASKSVAEIIGAGLTADEDEIVSELLPSLIAAARAILAAAARTAPVVTPPPGHAIDDR